MTSTLKNLSLIFPLYEDNAYSLISRLPSIRNIDNINDVINETINENNNLNDNIDSTIHI
jgi:hypothetical protein